MQPLTQVIRNEYIYKERDCVCDWLREKEGQAVIDG